MTDAPDWKPTGGFSIGYRNPGHWDIADRYGRAFRIRGEPGAVTVTDERVDASRPFPRDWLRFKSIHAALLYIADEMMQEPRS
jgi:hypothetical protein